MPLNGYERNQRWNAKKRDIQQKANAIVSERIRRLVKRDKILCNSLFSFPVIKVFANQEGLSFNQVIAVMLMDIYPGIRHVDSLLWGFEKQSFRNAAMELVKREYAFREREKEKATKYCLTLKGKNLVKEFNIYYDEHVKKLFKSIGIRDSEIIRKVTRVPSARLYKPRDQAAGGKPAANSARKRA